MTDQVDSIGWVWYHLFLSYSYSHLPSGTETFDTFLLLLVGTEQLILYSGGGKEDSISISSRVLLTNYLDC